MRKNMKHCSQSHFQTYNLSGNVLPSDSNQEIAQIPTEITGEVSKHFTKQQQMYSLSSILTELKRI